MPSLAAEIDYAPYRVAFVLLFVLLVQIFCSFFVFLRSSCGTMAPLSATQAVRRHIFHDTQLTRFEKVYTFSFLRDHPSHPPSLPLLAARYSTEFLRDLVKRGRFG